MNKKHPNYTVWIEAEEWSTGSWTPDDTNTDVIVTYEDGSRWVASFFTYSNILTLTEKNKRTGECMSGAYFWSSDMILIDIASRERIEEAIDDILKEGTLECIFTSLQPEEPDEN